jgi:hypothetical protein
LLCAAASSRLHGWRVVTAGEYFIPACPLPSDFNITPRHHPQPTDAGAFGTSPGDHVERLRRRYLISVSSVISFRVAIYEVLEAVRRRERQPEMGVLAE